jgi:nucleotide-binding universal stress UspA family protein
MSLNAATLKPRSVLIATDFSAASERPLRHSLALARFYGARLCLVHVISSMDLAMAGAGAIAVCEEAVLREAAELKDSLIRSGALAGIQHKFIVRRGEIWPALREIIRQENADLVLAGTHGRHGVGKLFFGSIAEQIFRQADCPVLIFGPHCDDRPWFERCTTPLTFLLATDFGHASLHGLPRVVAAANQLGAKLAFLSIVPAAPSDTDGELKTCQTDARMTTLQRLTELVNDAGLDLKPELYVESKSERPVSEKIIEAAGTLRADLIMMGLHHSDYAGVISHLDLAITYDVACQAGCPVLIFSPFLRV